MEYRGSPYDMEPSNLPEMEGKRVRLKPDEEEGWPEAFGHVRSADKLTWGISLVVDLEPAYLENEDDDGLREVTLDQIEFVSEK